MHGTPIPKVVAAIAIVAVGLIAYATPGASAPGRAGEYPLAVIVTDTTPKRPKAGKPFTAIVGVFNQETQAPVESGDVACPARIGGHGIRMTDKAFIAGTGIAGCTWRMPPKAGGKRLVARVEVYSDEGTVRSRFLRVVRP